MGKLRKFKAALARSYTKMSTRSRPKKRWARMCASVGAIARSRRLLSGSLVLLVNIAGCSIYGPAVRNTFYEPRLLVDQTATCIRDCCLADSTWREYRKENADEYSTDYANGFKAGFQAYLKYGANTGIPPVPPKHYWWIEQEGPGAMARAADWHDGV